MALTSIIIISFIQGLTEFLPVSSSGHLLLFRLLFSPYSQPVTLDVFLHAGSLLAIIWYFRRYLRQYFVKLIPVLIIGTIPVVVIGLFIYSHFQSVFETPQFLGLSFLFTSFCLFLFPYLPKGKTSLEKISFKQSLLIGIFQAVAIIPAISRSGSTIFAGKLSGLKTQASFNFAFILAIPAIFGAIILVLKDLSNYQPQSMGIDITGLFFSFFSSLIALRLLNYFLKNKNLKIFSLYTFLLGLLCLSLFSF